jgi:hypothetical protein
MRACSESPQHCGAAARALSAVSIDNLCLSDQTPACEKAFAEPHVTLDGQ